MKFAWNGLSNIIDSENSTFLIDKNPKFDVFVIILPVEVGIISLYHSTHPHTPTPSPVSAGVGGEGLVTLPPNFQKGGLKESYKQKCFSLS